MTINLWAKPKPPKKPDVCEAPAGLLEALIAVKNSTFTKEMWDRLLPAKELKEIKRSRE